jgi:hypothetical protein
MNERLVRQEVGAKYDAERDRKGDVIAQMIAEQAARGKMFTMTQFTELFENKAGLGGKTVIRDRLNVLATKGYLKFVRQDAVKKLGLAADRSKYGYLCVEDMTLKTGIETINPQTGEVTEQTVFVLPSHYKCPQTGAVLPVENPEIWVYPAEEK